MVRGANTRQATLDAASRAALTQADSAIRIPHRIFTSVPEILVPNTGTEPQWWPVGGCASALLDMEHDFPLRSLRASFALTAGAATIKGSFAIYELTPYGPGASSFVPGASPSEFFAKLVQGSQKFFNVTQGGAFTLHDIELYYESEIRLHRDTMYALIFSTTSSALFVWSPSFHFPSLLSLAPAASFPLIEDTLTMQVEVPAPLIELRDERATRIYTGGIPSTRF